MENLELIANIRESLLKTIDTSIVPIGSHFLGNILGALHISTQILDVASINNREAFIKLAEGAEVQIGEFLLFSNTILTLANEKLQLPDELKNV